MTRISWHEATVGLAVLLLTNFAICGITVRAARAQAPGPVADAPATDVPAADVVEQKPETSVDDEETIRIRVWLGSGAMADEFVYQVNKFNDSQDEIIVEPRSFGGYDNAFQALLKAFQTKDVPDAAIVEIHSIAALAADQRIQPLDDLIQADRKFRPDDLLAGMLSNLHYRGKLVALPINRSTPVLYYNKDRFTEAGLNAEKPPETWQEVQKISRVLTSDDQSHYGFLAPSFPWIFESLVWSNGGKLIEGKRATFAEPASKPLQMWADMVHRDKTARYCDRHGATSEFVNGQAAMALESTAMLHMYSTMADFEVGTAVLPRCEGFANAVPTGGGAAVLPASISGRRREAVWTFLTWFINTKQAAEWSRATGYIPVRESAHALLQSKGFYDDNPEYETAIKQMKFARESPQLPQWPDAWRIIGTTMTSIVRDNAPALETLKGAEEKVDALLKSGSD